MVMIGSIHFIISGPLLLFASFPSLIDNFWLWVAGAVLLGFGTALVYPTLLAAIGDVVHPGWRASAVEVYRLWRDLGYDVGALLSGILGDLFGLVWAVLVVGALTFGSGVIVALRMKETVGGMDD